MLRRRADDSQRRITATTKPPSGDAQPYPEILPLPAIQISPELAPVGPHDGVQVAPPRTARAGLSPLERMDCAFFAATTGGYLQSHDIALVAATSVANHRNLQHEAGRRLVREFAAYWRANAVWHCSRLDELLANGWNMLAHMEAPRHFFALGFYEHAACGLQAYCGRLADSVVLAHALLQLPGKAGEAMETAGTFRKFSNLGEECSLVCIKACLLQGDVTGALEQLEAYDSAGYPYSYRRELTGAMFLHSCGDEATARDVVDQIACEAVESVDGDRIAADIAEAYAWLGDADSAIRWMRRAMQSASRPPLLLPLSRFAKNIGDHAMWKMLEAAAREYLASVELQPFPPLPPS
jgi:hypothetical protein